MTDIEAFIIVALAFIIFLLIYLIGSIKERELAKT